jgi:hypothetical protein
VTGIGGGAPAAEVFLFPHPESNAAPKSSTVAAQANISALRAGTAITLAGRAFINLPNYTSSFLLSFEALMDSNTNASPKIPSFSFVDCGCAKLDGSYIRMSLRCRHLQNGD